MASEELKRQPSELIARYSLEPSLKEIYVEGLTDKLIVELFLEKENLLSTTCYEVSSIDFSEFIALNPHLRSNKEKLIYLANDIFKNLNPANLKLRCIIDRDFDDILGIQHTSGFILSSDFSCIEAYILDEFTFKKILRIGLTNFPIDEKVMLAEMFKVLNNLFFIRCARVILKHEPLKLLEMDSAININKNGIIDFELEEYINKYVNKNHIHKDYVEGYLKQINDLKSQNCGNRLQYFNGHDFIKLFFKYINVIKNTAKFKEDNFEKTLYVALEISALGKYPLFTTIKHIYQ